MNRRIQQNFKGRWVNFCKIGIFLAPLVFIFTIICVKLRAKGWYNMLVREDGPFEVLTALAYLVGCIVAFSMAKEFYRQKSLFWGIAYISLSIGFLFICLEEISWGQRILKMSTPQFFEEHNYQKEINLHNLAGRYLLHGAYIIVGGYGTFGRVIVEKLLPGRFKAFADLFVPYWFLITYFFPIFLLYLYYDYLSAMLVTLFGSYLGWDRLGNSFIIGRDQETAEFILSLGFMLFVGINRWRLKARDFSSIVQAHKQKIPFV